MVRATKISVILITFLICLVADVRAHPPQEVILSTRNSIVTIYHTMKVKEQEYIYSGSGVIVAPGNLVITNEHVVRRMHEIERADGIKENIVSYLDSYDVRLADGTKVRGTLERFDPEIDLAILKLPRSYTYVFMNKAVYGEGVFVIGTPMGIYHNAVTAGIVSFITSEYFLFDSSIFPGNSGGGVFNASGELIGIAQSFRASSRLAVDENGQMVIYSAYFGRAISVKIIQEFLLGG